MQLFMDEERLGLARVVAVHQSELRPADVDDAAPRVRHGKDGGLLAAARGYSVGEEDQAQIAGARLAVGVQVLLERAARGVLEFGEQLLALGPPQPLSRAHPRPPECAGLGTRR